MKRLATLCTLLLASMAWISMVPGSGDQQESAALQGMGTGEYLQKADAERQKQIQLMIKIITAKPLYPPGSANRDPEWWNKHQFEIAQKREAIQVLGLLRAKEAVAPLIGDITLGAPMEFEMRPFDELYPAIHALISIGNPASDALLARLEEGTPKGSSDYSSLYLYTLCKIENPYIARVKIENRIKRAESSQKKRRLADLLVSSVFDLVDSELEYERK